MAASQRLPGSSPEPRSSRVAAHASATQQGLIDSARHLFVSKGYFNTGTEEIVRDAGVTRGALYHHFGNKKGLFLAVFKEIEQDLLNSAAANPLPGTAIERLESGLLGFLDASTTPEIQQVILVDGPAVLGWQLWRELEADYGLGSIQQMLADATAEGTLATQSIDALSHILLAAVDEAALFIANAPDPMTAREASAGAMRALLSGLLRQS
ncbi:MAG: TetR/AcrR family transcriptional regulator [Candidatus Nanopelagicales bacterium]